MKTSPLLLVSLSLLTALSACSNLRATPVPDHRIKVVTTPDGRNIAVPPECLSWAKNEASPFDNQSLPQFGCATARNLAAMVEDPGDLVEPRQAGDADGALTATSVDLYRTGKTKPLTDVSSTTSNSGP